MKLWFNLLCHDIDAQLTFYRDLLGLPEAAKSRSPIYRALETADFQFGFNAMSAYALLGLTDRQPLELEPPPVTAYATLMLKGPAAVSDVVARITALGGRVIKEPYPKYYGQWQAILADPESNVFRVASDALPAGVVRPAFPLATDRSMR